MAKCELNCHECRVKDCGFRDLNAFSGGSVSSEVQALLKSHATGAKIHVRIDAKEATKRLKGLAGGGVGVGVPSAIEMEPGAYVTDQLKTEYNMTHAEDSEN